MGGGGSGKGSGNRGGGYSGKGKDVSSGGSRGKGKGKSSGGGEKPTDSPDFVVWRRGMRLDGSRLNVSYVVDDYVASGTFSRVFKVRRVTSDDSTADAESGGVRLIASASSDDAAEAAQKRRWNKGAGSSSSTSSSGAEGQLLAAKVMRKHDTYIQYTSDGQKEGEMLQKVEQVQLDAGREVLTMRCLDSFETRDDAGSEYWCLILEWLDASIFDLVKANGNRGLHLSMVRVMLEQLLQQLHVLQQQQITHTDIKHKNCCLVDGEHFMAPVGSGGRQTVILTQPLAKFIDYGNAVFESDKKVHPIHTKQFRAPEVLLNVAGGWGPPSDTWTVGVTAAFMISGQLIFNSHDPGELIRAQVAALGAFPETFLANARDNRVRKAAEDAARRASVPQLSEWLGLSNASQESAEARCTDLISRMLAPDPAMRISAEEALKHSFFKAAEPKIPARPDGVQVQQLSDISSRQGKGKASGK